MDKRMLGTGRYPEFYEGKSREEIIKYAIGLFIRTKNENERLSTYCAELRSKIEEWKSSASFYNSESQSKDVIIEAERGRSAAILDVNDSLRAEIARLSKSGQRQVLYLKHASRVLSNALVAVLNGSVPSEESLAAVRDFLTMEDD